MVRKEPGKLYLVILFIACILLVAVFVFSVIISSKLKNAVVDYSSVNATLTVGDYVGLNLDTDKIHFGTVSTKGYSKRGITFSSAEEGYVYVTAEGSLAGLIYMDRENLFRVSRGENVSFIVYASPAIDSRHGSYEATIHFYVLESNPGFFVKRFLSGAPLTVFNRAGMEQPTIRLNISENSSS